MGNNLNYFIEDTSRVWLQDTLAPYGTNIYTVVKTAGYSPVAGTTIFPDLFDEFNDSSINTNKWNTDLYGTTKSITETTNITLSTVSGSVQLTSKSSFTTNKAIEYVFTMGTPAYYNSRHRFNPIGSSDWGIFYSNNTVYWNGASTSTTLSTTETYRLIEYFQPAISYGINIVGKFTGSSTTNVTAIGAKVLGGDYHTSSGYGKISISRIFAREYVSPEPTVTVIDQGDRYQVVVQNTTDKTLSNYQFCFNASSIGGVAASESLLIVPNVRQNEPDIFKIWNNCQYYYDINGSITDVTGRTTTNAMGGVSLISNRFSQSKRALHFDGLDDRVDITNTNALDLSGDYTIFMILVHNPADTTQYLISCRDSDSDNKGFECGLNGNYPFFNVDTGANYIEMISDVPFANNIYYAAVKSGTTQTLYINGYFIKSNTVDAVNLNTDSITNIGRSFTGTNFYSGEIETIIAWNRGLSFDEYQLLVKLFGKRYIYPTHNARTVIDGKVYDKQRGY